MAAGQTPGNAKTNPFGDGAGGAGMAQQKPANFVTDPGGGGGGGAPKPRNLVGAVPGTSEAVAPTVPEKSARHPESVPAGGPLPFQDRTEDAGNPIGTVPGKATHMPMRLK